MLDKEGLPVLAFFIYIFEKKAGVKGKVTYAPAFFFENMCMKRHVSYTYFCTCVSLQKGGRRFGGSDIVSVVDWQIQRVKHSQTNLNTRGMTAFNFSFLQNSSINKTRFCKRDLSSSLQTNLNTRAWLDTRCKVFDTPSKTLRQRHSDRKKPPSPGGFLFIMFLDQELCVRDFTTGCDRRISSWNLLHTALDQGTE